MIEFRHQASKHWFEILILLSVAGSFLFLQRNAEITYSDPDRYYHLALSREAVKSGKWFLDTLPAVEGLGWNQKFAEKEFLFHQITTLGYRLGEEEGVALLVSLFAILTYATLFRFASRSLPKLEALTVLLAVFCTPIFLLRLYLLRPHVPALFAFSLLLYGLCMRRQIVIFFSCLVFSLTYHAIYIPAIVLILAPLISYHFEPAERRQRFISFLAGAGGLALGVLCNPYFPTNISLAVQIAKLPFLLQGELKGVSFGTELYRLGFTEYLQRFSISVIFFFLGAAFFLTRMNRWKQLPAEDRKQISNFVFLLALNAIFLLLTLISPRAGEYLILSTGFLLVPFLYFARPSPKTSLMVALLFVAHFAVTNARSYQSKIWVSDSLPVGEYLLAMESFPPEPRGAKVFNCEWDQSPYIFYKRPDLRFIDILDPGLLFFHDKIAFSARQRILRGEAENLYQELKVGFGANYALCSQPVVVKQMQSDVRFRQLYPHSSNTMAALPHIFELVPERKAD